MLPRHAIIEQPWGPSECHNCSVCRVLVTPFCQLAGLCEKLRYGRRVPRGNPTSFPNYAAGCGRDCLAIQIWEIHSKCRLIESPKLQSSCVIETMQNLLAAMFAARFMSEISLVGRRFLVLSKWLSGTTTRLGTTMPLMKLYIVWRLGSLGYELCRTDFGMIPESMSTIWQRPHLPSKYCLSHLASKACIPPDWTI